jgi:hypothetical protein
VEARRQQLARLVDEHRLEDDIRRGQGTIADVVVHTEP